MSLLPLPFDVMQHVLSFIPPLWTEVTRETPVPPDGYFKLVVSPSRYRYKFARFYLLTPGYNFQELKRGEVNFATCEAELFLKWRGVEIHDTITIGDIFPLNSTSQALDALMRFNYEMIIISMNFYDF